MGAEITQLKEAAVLDDIDLAIVRALRRDARLSIRALAEEIHVSRSTAHERVNRLLERGVISGFSAVVDPAQAGLTVRALLVVDTGATPEGAGLADALLEIPFVVRVQTIAGDIDYVVEIAAPTHDALSNLVLRRVLRLPGVHSVRTHLIIGEQTRDPIQQPPADYEPGPSDGAW
ncbi:Lrp/AsnC family transcriptional regulator [Gulosibacter chungangensis]|uniref:Lrp/AsnC family transcriptional regulator n=1 Tax=Gulosibacter chungangensis TaxID=979746 RepID=A0A7J5BFF8_9MICO|nr:Lrp/AsnC family transcriptional regulator [Gulosibacter chungangensis]